MNKLIRFELYKLSKSKLLILSLIIILLSIITLVFVSKSKMEVSEMPAQQSDEVYYTERIDELSELYEVYDDRNYLHKKETYIFLRENNIPRESWRRYYASQLGDIKSQIDETESTELIRELNQREETIKKAILENDWVLYLEDQISKMESEGSVEFIIEVEREMLDFRKAANIPVEHNTWQEHYLNEIKYNKIDIARNETDNPFIKLNQEQIEELELTIKLKEQMVIRQIPPLDTGGFRYYLAQVQKLGGLVTVFSILLAAMISVGEISEGSIGALLFTPYKRRKILLSKVIVVHAFALAIMFFTIVFAFLIGILFYGTGELGYDTLLAINGSVRSINQFALLILRFCLSLPAIISAVALTFMLAYLTKNGVVTSILAVFLSFLGEPISQFVIAEGSIVEKLWLYSNMTIYSGIDYLYIIKTSAMILPLIVVGIYTTIFYLAGLRLLNHFDINT